MKIVHISINDSGGAGLCALRIHTALLKNEVDSKMVCMYTSSHVENIFPIISKKNSILKKVLRRFKIFSITEKLDHNIKILNRIFPNILYTSPLSNYQVENEKLINEANIIHIHWIAGFINYPSFFKKIYNKNVVWTLYDENPYLGGFHYEERDKEIIKKFEKLEILFKAIKIKCAHTIRPCHIVSLSREMMQKAEKTEIFSPHIHSFIHMGFDVNLFKKRNKLFSRNVLNLNKNCKIILFVAQSLEDKRKGLHELIEALNLINVSSIEMLCIGGGDLSIFYKYNLTKLGFITDERLLSIAYSASDLFVTPSYQETFGQTTIEAMACGIPVVSFPNAGAKDIINETNGILTKDFTIDALKEAILQALSKDWDKESIIEGVKKRFSSTIMTNKYIKLYKDIV